MRLVAACKVCRVPVLTADGLGNQAAERMRTHLREAHAESTTSLGIRIADLLRWFDVYKAAA